MCPIAFILFDERDWQGEVLKPMKNDHCLIFFSCLSSLHHVFGQVKGWLILELHKIKYLSHVVACPVIYILFYDQGW